MDEELKVTHVEMLSRFYKLFETVHGYAIDFKSYLNELDEGRFIQNSIETLFLDMDGKQLLVRKFSGKEGLSKRIWISVFG